MEVRRQVTWLIEHRYLYAIHFKLVHRNTLWKVKQKTNTHLTDIPWTGGECEVCMYMSLACFQKGSKLGHCVELSFCWQLRLLWFTLPIEVLLWSARNWECSEMQHSLLPLHRNFVTPLCFKIHTFTALISKYSQIYDKITNMICYIKI